MSNLHPEERETLLPRHVGERGSSDGDDSNSLTTKKKTLFLGGMMSLAVIGIIGASFNSGVAKTTSSLLQRVGFPGATHLLVDYEPASTVVFSKGSYGYEDLGKETTDGLFVGIGSIWKRECEDCVDSHKLIYYKRLTPVSDALSIYDNMKNTWSSEDNILNRDFELYSSYEDLVDEQNKWEYCNYDDVGIAFPRDCGPVNAVSDQWNSETNTRTKLNVKYSILATASTEDLEAYIDATEGSLVYSTGDFGDTNLGKNETDELFQSVGSIFYRECSDCADSHKVIFYKRLTEVGDFSVYDNMVNTWSSEGNELNADFEMYGSYEDLVAGTNKWTFCNFDDTGVAFPRDCGPSSGVSNQWNSEADRFASATRKNVAFYILGALSASYNPNEPQDEPTGVTVYSKGEYGDYDMGAGMTDAMFSEVGAIMKRECSSCIASHQLIYYERITPIPDGWSIYDNIKNVWASEDNIINEDFRLFSTYEDLIKGENGWTYCNYNDHGGKVGFPRDCGPANAVTYQWNSELLTDKSQPDFKYSILNVNTFDEITAFFTQLPEPTERPTDIPVEVVDKNSLLVYSTGEYGDFDLGKDETNSKFTDLSGVFYRECTDCSIGHRLIFYKRINSELGDFSPYDNMVNTWSSASNNLNEDFELYGSLEDLVAGTNKWTFCNYDQDGIAFPRDCGPSGAVGTNWFSQAENFADRTKKNVAYYILTYSPEYIEVEATEPDVCGVVYSTGSYGEVDVGNLIADSMFTGVGSILKRECEDCISSHRLIYYERITPIPEEDWSLYGNIKITWGSEDNVLNNDFRLFSTYDDLQKNTNGWTYCNYNDEENAIGFPRDCGPVNAVNFQWNSELHSATRRHVKYCVVGVPVPTAPIAAEQDADASSVANATAPIVVPAPEPTEPAPVSNTTAPEPTEPAPVSNTTAPEPTEPAPVSNTTAPEAESEDTSSNSEVNEEEIGGKISICNQNDIPVSYIRDGVTVPPGCVTLVDKDITTMTANPQYEYASIVTICADASAGTFLFDEEHLSDYDLIFQGSSLVSALGSGMQSTAVVYEDDAAAGEANKRFLPISSGRHTRFVSLQGQKYVSDAKVIASNIYSLELTSATEELSDCASTISEKYRNDKAAKAKKTLNLSEHKKGERWSEEEKELLKKKKKELRKRNAMAMRNKK